MSFKQGKNWFWTQVIFCMMDETVSMDIVTIKGVKNIFLGGEGLFNTVVTGPGKVVVQTLPANAMASNLMRFFPSK